MQPQLELSYQHVFVKSYADGRPFEIEGEGSIVQAVEKLFEHRDAVPPVTDVIDAFGRFGFFVTTTFDNSLEKFTRYVLARATPRPGSAISRDVAGGAARSRSKSK